MLTLRYSLRNVIRGFGRSMQSAAAPRNVPEPQGKIATPNAFLSAIGRGSEKKASVDSWDAFWRMSGRDFKGAGVPARDRRYILWCMEKFRQGVPIERFAHELKSRKKIRGWGPAVQDGKRIR